MSLEGVGARIERLRMYLSTFDSDALFITFLPDIRWACGFTGSNGILIVRADDAVFLTDGRYEAQAAREIKGARVVMGGYDLPGHAAENDLLAGCRSAVYQSNHLSVAAFDKLRELFGAVQWKGSDDLLVRDVASKDSAEINRIRAAQRLTEKVFEDILAWLHEGVSEKEVAAEVVYRHHQSGAERMSFEPIVASGPNSALPHGLPTDRRLRRGEVLLLDFGCFLNGYASDMTRTIALGDPGDEVRAVYNLVHSAQDQAIAAARSGISSRELDDVARRIIKEGGYGEYFSHSLGHGVGLQIHEWPRVSYSVDYELPTDCAVTIEPGIYLPDRFGVRLEDIVVLRKGGCENLTSAPKDLIIL